MPRKKPRKKKPLSKQAAFLAAYVRTASITRAAKAVRMDRVLHYRWLKEDDAYAVAFNSATEQAAETLESEAIRRAHMGVNEPLVYQGQFTYPEKVDADGVVTRSTKPLSVNKKSDTLLMFLLKGFRPDRYRDRVSAEVSGPGGGPIPLADESLSDLSDDELESLVALALKLKPKK